MTQWVIQHWNRPKVVHVFTQILLAPHHGSHTSVRSWLGPAILKCGHQNYFEAEKRANKEEFLLAGRQARDYIIKCDGSPNAVAPDYKMLNFKDAYRKYRKDMQRCMHIDLLNATWYEGKKEF